MCRCFKIITSAIQLVATFLQYILLSLIERALVLMSFICFIIMHVWIMDNIALYIFYKICYIFLIKYVFLDIFMFIYQIYYADIFDKIKTYYFYKIIIFKYYTHKLIRKFYCIFFIHEKLFFCRTYINNLHDIIVNSYYCIIDLHTNKLILIIYEARSERDQWSQK